MKKLLFSLTMACLATFCWAADKKNVVDYVNVMVGTESTFELSTGNTYPAIAMPWGMNFWVPQTGKMGDGWQYMYGATKIRGLKQTHQPSPWINDYGQFSLMPTVGKPVFDEEKRASWYSHKAETATPYYYNVYLADYDVTAELAPTDRAVLMQFTFPESSQANVVVDAFDKGSHVDIDVQRQRVTGYSVRNSGGVTENFKNWFVVEFDKPFEIGLKSEELGADYAEKGHAGAIVTFKTRRGEKVSARVASSFISLEQAERNLKELGNDNMEQVKQKGRQRWNDVLGRIEIEDDNIDHLRTFYSCLYLVYPSMNAKMQEGLANTYLESGFLPEWASPGHRNCMVGNNSASIVADAYLKGVTFHTAPEGANPLWQAVVHGANAVHPDITSTGRAGYEYYNKLGYVPCDVKINESAARTLEYAYDDWCIYQFGKALGKKPKELAPYKKRAMNYRNLFDPETKLMRGKKENGEFQTPYNPLKWGDVFTEGNGWHYTWSVFHDPQGLIDLMGGNAVFNQMLDSVFNLPPIFDDSYYGFPIHEIREMQIMNFGNYAHGNQPIQHMIYLYGYSGQPWKTQYWIRQVMDRLYTPNPDGYCGDEDNGQTSAWYVFSALGFYPVCPGSNQYVLGTPYFRDVKLHLENGNTLNISMQGDGCYINRMTFNGGDYGHNFLNHFDLMKGGDIRFMMSQQPNRQRGTAAEDAPYSFSKDN